ncbi:MAG TPA: hypothetical protein VFA46_17140 [Actinomycetes bacterium]|jgi:hypothetical protein|nr:hypothetical protein [Actinomycetes bacterium]
MKRAFWALLGLGIGAVIGVGVMRWASRTAERLTPQSMGQRALEAALQWRERVADALEEGRAAMAEREAELRAQLVEPGDEAS